MWRITCRNEQDAVEAERSLGLTGDGQVAVVNWVERTAEEPKMDFKCRGLGTGVGPVGISRSHKIIDRSTSENNQIISVDDLFVLLRTEPLLNFHRLQSSDASDRI